MGFPRREHHAPIDALISLRALTLNMRGVELRAQDLHVSFHQYNVTHLCLDHAPNRSAAREILPLLRQQLVSFRIVLAPLTGELSPFQRWSLRFRSDLHLWPTQVLDDTVLPALRHLEICESDYTYHPTDVHTPHRFIDFAAHAWRDACPVLRTFVWRPSPFHEQLVKSQQSGKFCDALREYTDALFSAWPALECVERPRLEDAEFPFTDTNAPYVAFLRVPRIGQGGGVVGEPRYEARLCVYDSERWKSA